MTGPDLRLKSLGKFLVLLPTQVGWTRSRCTEEKSVPIAVGGRTFTLFFFPSKEEISRAKDLLLRGECAGLIPFEIVSPQAVFFDMDGTVIDEESLVEIAKAAGKYAAVEELTTRAMNGELDFSESLKARLQILKGQPKKVVNSVKPTLKPGMIELASYCAEAKIPMFLVSGGFVDLAEPLAKKLGFTGFKANQFAWDGDVLTGELKGDFIDSVGKALALDSWSKEHGLDLKRCIAVGDGANDLPMLKTCGISIGLSPKAILWPHISINNALGDHRLLLEILKSCGLLAVP